MVQVSHRLRKTATFVTSFAIHICLLLLLSQWKGVEPAATISSTLDVTILQGRKSGRPTLKEAKSTKAQSSVASDLNRFMMSTNYSHRGRVGIESEKDGGLGEGVMPFGFESGNLKRLEFFSIYERIYRAIEGNLVYPSVLASEKIEGTVLVQFLILKDGRVDWRSLKISGNRYLKIYIVRLLLGMFQSPLPTEAVRQLEKPLPVDLIFDFRITESDDPSLKKQREFVMGQVLAFYRNFQHSSLQWKIGPLSGLFPLPVVNLDILGLIKSIADPSDPLAEFVANDI